MAAWAVLYIKVINNGSANLHFGISFKKMAMTKALLAFLADKMLFKTIFMSFGDFALCFTGLL
ncbi:MAG: hypothetical protein GX025_00695 [Clostridiales bacterium]|jgi:hypothetical protein|nr:hypothetical protein [Clostridiales bacterium]